MNKSTSTLELTDVQNSTWGERLLLNLFSYSLIVGPVAFIVLATRYRLWPATIQTSALIQRFVYGTVQLSSSNNSNQSKGSNERLLVEDTKELSQRPPIKDARSTNSALSLIWCFIGLQLSYLVWGILQEKIMTTEYEATGGLLEKPKHLEELGDNLQTTKVITFHDSQFLVFINRIIAFILSIIALVYNRPKKSPLYSGKYIHQQVESKPQAPLYEYIYCSLSNILSSWCQYEALKYVNFPTQVLSKSCKIVPVMLMSKIMLRKRYQRMDYFFALLLSLGMFVFLVNQPAPSKMHTNDHPDSSRMNITSQTQQRLANLNKLGNHLRNSSLTSGLVILALYLAFDSFTSNWQQSLFTRYGVSNWQMMAATNFYSIVLTLTSLHQLGTLGPAFKLLASSSPLLIDCLLMSIMSSIGQLFVYYTIKKFGSVIFAVIMTLRQFLAILLSCLIYGHQITMGSSGGLLLVFFVVGLQMWRKSGKSNLSRQSSKPEAAGGLKIQFKPVAK